ncbi:replication protein A 32 kDa subunit-like isoform X1 [Paramacrobiotus metropolitanus]|uniref:replication protein A 32 kDa subunit-like isoform X1 n=1 Tax=Paramacrobiotus metropolitanus TaxID=2943436 RepID=UPI0024457BDB|nr:replication protein A 32 kDa subunit-like isoform X1 [Paramacrobiotus metropolitanus]XP_055328141.1 replication protein A 32 kDa subunit-like isoform X1 [Paramacrobiotus metropolitanus]
MNRSGASFNFGGGSGIPWNDSSRAAGTGASYPPGGSHSVGGGFLSGDTATSATQMDGAVKGVGKSMEVVPVTIAEVVTSPDLKHDRMKIGNMEVHRVTLVAQVRECRQTSTYTSLTLDDKTGATLEAKIWGESQEEVEAAAVATGQYVRVYGTVKSVNDNVMLTAYSVQRVKDLNEVSFHMLDVIHSHVMIAKCAQAGPAAGTQEFPAASSSFVASTPSRVDLMDYQASGMDGGFSVGQHFAPLGLTPMQSAVFAYCQTGSETNGRDIRLMISELPPQFRNKQLIEDALQYLSQEGQIYNTVDDFHYKSVEY